MNRLTKDFITLYNAFWYRDFPITRTHKPFGSRAEWTTHIGICVRSCADMLGYFTHFEAGIRTDAVIRDNQAKDIVHVEWEWQEPRRDGVNEIKKLRVSSASAKLSVLITYSDIEHHNTNLAAIQQQWSSHPEPLVVLLVTFERKGGRRYFDCLETYHLQSGVLKRVRSQEALPWQRVGTRWEYEEAGE